LIGDLVRNAIGARHEIRDGLVGILLFDLFDDHGLEVGDAGRGIQHLGGDLSAFAPLRGLVIASELLEHGGARREESRTPLEGAVGVEFGDVQLAQSTVGLAEIEADPPVTTAAATEQG
jgi:hypothetical protein